MLSERFDQALGYASDVHREQARKGTTIPYLSHLLGVCSLVLEDGGDEDEAIAALLHDACEDQGGRERLADIRSRFGDGVARAILRDHRQLGDDLWARFNAGKDDQLWYVRALADTCAMLTNSPLASELDELAEVLGAARNAPAGEPVANAPGPPQPHV